MFHMLPPSPWPLFGHADHLAATFIPRLLGSHPESAGTCPFPKLGHSLASGSNQDLPTPLPQWPPGFCTSIVPQLCQHLPAPAAPSSLDKDSSHHSLSICRVPVHHHLSGAADFELLCESSEWEVQLGRTRRCSGTEGTPTIY